MSAAETNGFSEGITAIFGNCATWAKLSLREIPKSWVKMINGLDSVLDNFANSLSGDSQARCGYTSLHEYLQLHSATPRFVALTV
jgi:hypothetical protein